MARATATWPSVWSSKNFPIRPLIFFLLALLLAVAVALAYLNGLIFKQTAAPTYQRTIKPRSPRANVPQ